MEILLLNETKGRMVAKTLQSEQGTRAPAKNRVCRAGGTDHRCELGPQMLSRTTHAEFRLQDAAVLRTALFHNNTTGILRFWIQGCPIPGSVQAMLDESLSNLIQ